MVDEDGSENPRVNLGIPRPLSWRTVALVLVDSTEDMFLTVASGLGHLRGVLVSDIEWRDGNAKLLAEIEALPTVPGLE